MSNEWRPGIIGQVETECARSKYGLRLKYRQLLQIAKRQDWLNKGVLLLKSDFLEIFDIESPYGDLTLVIPWCGSTMLPNEIFATSEGNLPQAVALEKELFGYCWRHKSESRHQKFFMALEQSARQWGKSIRWEWKDGRNQGRLDWGLQVAPLKQERFLMVMQNGAKAGMLTQMSFGLDAFVEARHAIGEVVRGIQYQGASNDLLPHPTLALIAIAKAKPNLYREIAGPVPEEIVTEHDYEQILDQIVKESREEKIGETDNQAVEQFLGRHQKAINRLVKHHIYFKGALDPEKIGDEIRKEISSKIFVQATGLDEKKIGIFSCLGLAALAIILLLIWGTQLEVIWKIVLSFLSVVIIVAVGFLALIWTLRRKSERGA